MNYASIYDYLIQAQRKGFLKSYQLRLDKYVEIDRYINDSGYNDNYCNAKYMADSATLAAGKQYQSAIFLKDSLKEVSIDQILFIQDHKLKCRSIIAGTEYIVMLDSIIRLGSSVKSLCCINTTTAIDTSKKDKITFLKTTYQLINADSDYYSKIYSLKKMYGMNLITTLWYDLSKGYNDVLDIKTNTMIPASQIWDYSDTLQQPIFDSLGDSIGYKKIATNPLLYSFSSLGIYQDWYYNITRNIFFCKIKQVDIYAPTAKAEDGYNWINEKRFKIIFK